MHVCSTMHRTNSLGFVRMRSLTEGSGGDGRRSFFTCEVGSGGGGFFNGRNGQNLTISAVKKRFNKTRDPSYQPTFVVAVKASTPKQ
jgi:hypothetical protein